MHIKDTYFDATLFCVLFVADEKTLRKRNCLYATNITCYSSAFALECTYVRRTHRIFLIGYCYPIEDMQFARQRETNHHSLGHATESRNIQNARTFCRATFTRDVCQRTACFPEFRLKKPREAALGTRRCFAPLCGSRGLIHKHVGAII